MVDYLAKFAVSQAQAPAVLRREWLRVALVLHPDHNPTDARAAEAFVEAKKQFDKARRIAQEEPCSTCRGSGKTSLGRGFHTVSLDCVSCEGSGKKWPTS